MKKYIVLPISLLAEPTRFATISRDARAFEALEQNLGLGYQIERADVGISTLVYILSREVKSEDTPKKNKRGRPPKRYTDSAGLRTGNEDKRDLKKAQSKKSSDSLQRPKKIRQNRRTFHVNKKSGIKIRKWK